MPVMGASASGGCLEVGDQLVEIANLHALRRKELSENSRAFRPRWGPFRSDRGDQEIAYLHALREGDLSENSRAFRPRWGPFRSAG